MILYRVNAAESYAKFLVIDICLNLKIIITLLFLCVLLVKVELLRLTMVSKNEIKLLTKNNEKKPATYKLSPPMAMTQDDIQSDRLSTAFSTIYLWDL